MAEIQDVEEIRRRCLEAGEDPAQAEFLARALSHENHGVSQAAMQALAKIPAGAVVEKVLPLLRGDDEGARNRAREVLQPIVGLEPQAFRDLLGDEDSNVRILAVEMLGLWGEPSLLEDLAALAATDPPSLRQQLSAALGKIHNPEAVSVLKELCEDEDEWVRFSAVEALGGVPHPQAEDALLGYLGHDDPLIQDAALEGLLSDTGVSGPKALLRLLALRGQTESGPRILAVLVTRLEKHEGRIPLAALEEAAPLLETLCREGGTWDRARAARAMGLLGTARFGPLLSEMVRRESGAPRVEAVEALGRIGFRQAEGLLDDVLQAEDTEVVERARKALDRMRKDGHG